MENDKIIREDIVKQVEKLENIYCFMFYIMFGIIIYLKSINYSMYYIPFIIIGVLVILLSIYEHYLDKKYSITKESLAEEFRENKGIYKCPKCESIDICTGELYNHVICKQCNTKFEFDEL